MTPLEMVAVGVSTLVFLVWWIGAVLLRHPDLNETSSADPDERGRAGPGPPGGRSRAPTAGDD